MSAQPKVETMEDEDEMVEDVRILVDALYPELRMIAGALSSRFGNPETLRSTALVSEVFLKLRRSPRFADEQHFLRTSARAMRHVLVNHARARMTQRRGGGMAAFPLYENVPVFWQSDADLVALDSALVAMEAQDARLAAVVECRFFGGYDDMETGKLLGMTDRTVRRDWVKARALLRTLLTDAAVPDEE